MLSDLCRTTAEVVKSQKFLEFRKLLAMSKNQKKLKRANHGKRPASNKARRSKRASLRI
jgi:hypothetical protein